MLTDMSLTGSYDLGLVALSALIAVLAAGAALDLAGRVTATHGRRRFLWAADGAFAMSTGAWRCAHVKAYRSSHNAAPR
jgi:NO-binding membrane sensor protein with MHYT domain